MPMSCMLARPQACCAQPLKECLNFRPKFWVSGWPSRNLDRAREYGVTSNASSGQTPGVRASGNVAHGISAGLARGDSGSGQAAHHAGRVFDVNVVQLEILPGGDVRDAVGIFLGEVGQRFQLLRIQSAGGNLDALHARSVPHGVRAFGQFRRRDSRAR